MAEQVALISDNKICHSIGVAARLRGAQANLADCDALYGEDPAFVRFLDEISETFVANAKKYNTSTLTTRHHLFLPENTKKVVRQHN